MKIIFLDIDGVLNGYNYWNLLGWSICTKLHIEKLYKKCIDPFGIHENKVKKLAKIVKKTNAKIVLSSSWRYRLWKIPYCDLANDEKRLMDLFIKYNLDIFDITPTCTNCDREREILRWLCKHEDDVENFIILDDENTFFRVFYENLIQTSSVSKGVMITGKRNENTGLKNKHVRKAIKILNKKENV